MVQERMLFRFGNDACAPRGKADQCLASIVLEPIKAEPDACVAGTMPSFSEAVPMLDERQPGASQIPCSLPAQPVIKEEAGLDEPSLLQPMERSQDLPATSSPRLAGFFDYSLMNGRQLSSCCPSTMQPPRG